MTMSERESLKKHTVPDWFHNAKLGIFIHWGLYSVPGYAPPTGEYKKVIAREGWKGWFARNPYAEWYLNSLRIRGSPTHHYHEQTYGQGFSYDDFVPLFNQAIEGWDPQEWANLFGQVGARYVVLTTKHHDGFLLWPSQYPNPKKEGYAVHRDLVGELARAVRSQGMRMGLYYSGGLDWTFEERPIRDIVDLFATIPQTADYVEYVDCHWRELINRYEPSLLWNDIGYPARANLNKLFADYYHAMPDGLVNDRFTQILGRVAGLLGNRVVRSLISSLLRWTTSHMAVLPACVHYDFRTPEYAAFGHITKHTWEATRGVGYSFGYNRHEGPEHLLSVEELVHLLVDIVSKNGNLLLNVGPMADGTIPELQRERLLGLGQWLEVNGEAIFDTRPVPGRSPDQPATEGKTDEGTAIRFTQKGDRLYAILLGKPRNKKITIVSLQANGKNTVHLLGGDSPLAWKQEGRDLTITLPEEMPESPAYVLRINPHIECGVALHQIVYPISYHPSADEADRTDKTPQKTIGDIGSIG